MQEKKNVMLESNIPRSERSRELRSRDRAPVFGAAFSASVVGKSPSRLWVQSRLDSGDMPAYAPGEQFRGTPDATTVMTFVGHRALQVSLLPYY